MDVLLEPFLPEERNPPAVKETIDRFPFEMTSGDETWRPGDCVNRFCRGDHLGEIPDDGSAQPPGFIQVRCENGRVFSDPAEEEGDGFMLKKPGPRARPESRVDDAGDVAILPQDSGDRLQLRFRRGHPDLDSAQVDVFDESSILPKKKIRRAGMNALHQFGILDGHSGQRGHALKSEPGKDFQVEENPGPS